MTFDISPLDVFQSLIYIYIYIVNDGWNVFLVYYIQVLFSILDDQSS